MSAINGKLFYSGYSEITPAQVASYLKRSFTTADTALVEDLITRIESELVVKCNRNFDTSKVYFETFNSGFTQVMLKNTPINSLKDIYIDGVKKTSLYTLNTNYFIYENTIIFTSPVVGATYPYNAVKIEYDIQKFWGEDVVNLLIKWVAFEYLNSENAGVAISNMNFDALSQNFDLAGFKKEKEEIIFRYTNFEI